jgi:hypothetical protein
MSKVIVGLLLFAALQAKGCGPKLKPAPPVHIACGPSVATPVKEDPGVMATVPVAMWIAADMDTHTSFQEPQRNFGQIPLVVADLPKGKPTYVRFLMPTLPGIEVLRAKLELFHSGKNEDGLTDDIQIPVVSNTLPWSPCTLTWNNAPQPFTGNEFVLNLRSQAWSGTTTDDPKLLAAVARQLLHPDQNHGFIFNYPATFPGIEKGFYSDNELSRTSTNLDRAPRLLLIVKLAPGATSSVITLPPLPPDNDLNTAAPPGTGTILMLKVAPAPGLIWPPSWDVSP